MFGNSFITTLKIRTAALERSVLEVKGGYNRFLKYHIFFLDSSRRFTKAQVSILYAHFFFFTKARIFKSFHFS